MRISDWSSDVCSSDLAFLIIRSITRPLDQIVGSLKAIATGDRSQKVAYDRHDEIGAIVTELDTVVDYLDKADAERTEERSGGKESVSTGGYRRMPEHYKKNT